MTERSNLIDTFIEGSPWTAWTRNPIAGDASGRRYERLCNGDVSVILMDAPPENGESTRPFAMIGQFLNNSGLCPPQILSHDTTLGVMVLSDLGADDFAKWLNRHPKDAPTLYQAAVDVLVHLDKDHPDLDLGVMTPEVGGQMVSLAADFYADDPTISATLCTAMSHSLATLAPVANTIALRDYHAENLIWRPEQSGHGRVGLLDFQDAFIAPAGYDLVSLLRDVRRDVNPALAEDMINYFIAQTGQGAEQFRAQLACLGAQRNLRILGVFARLSRVHVKKRYIDLIPRVWNNLMLDLAHPELAKLSTLVQDLLPVPHPQTLARLRGA